MWNNQMNNNRMNQLMNNRNMMQGGNVMQRQGESQLDRAKMQLAQGMACGDPWATSRFMEQRFQILGPPRPCPEDRRLTLRYDSDQGRDLFCDPAGFPHPDITIASKVADWCEKCGEGDWSWFLMGDTSNVGLDWLRGHVTLWVGYKKAIEQNPAMTNLQRMQWVTQRCTTLQIPPVFPDFGKVSVTCVMTEQIMRERANPPRTQVVVAPAAGAQTSSSTNTTTTNNTQNVQNNQQNHYYTINQAPAAPKQPQKLATCNSKMRVAAADFLLVKAGPERSKSDPKILKLHEQLLEGYKDSIVHQLLAEKAMAPPPEPVRQALPPPPTPAPMQPQQPRQPVVQCQQPQAVVAPQPLAQQATTTTTTTQSFSSSGFNSGWQQHGGHGGGGGGGNPGNTTMQQERQGGMQPARQQQGGHGGGGSSGMPMLQDQMAMGMADLSLGGTGTGEAEKKKKRKKKRPAAV